MIRRSAKRNSGLAEATQSLSQGCFADRAPSRVVVAELSKGAEILLHRQRTAFTLPPQLSSWVHGMLHSDSAAPSSIGACIASCKHPSQTCQGKKPAKGAPDAKQKPEPTALKPHNRASSLLAAVSRSFCAPAPILTLGNELEHAAGRER